MGVVVAPEPSALAPPLSTDADGVDPLRTPGRAPPLTA